MQCLPQSSGIRGHVLLPLGSRAVSVPHPQQLSANFNKLLPSQEETIDWTSLRNSSRLSILEWSLEVEVNLRPTISRPVRLGARRPSGTRDQFFFLLEIFFRQLRVYYFVTPSLTRGRVCNLLYNCFWAFPEQSLLDRNPANLTAIFYCLIWHSANLDGQVPVLISPRNRWRSYTPGHWADWSLNDTFRL
jgi:hypothetical protein